MTSEILHGACVTTSLRNESVTRRKMVALSEKCSVCDSWKWCGRMCKSQPAGMVVDRQTKMCVPAEDAPKLLTNSQYRHECAWCGSVFFGAWHGKFCSDRCRVKNHRVANGQQQARSISARTRFRVFARDEFRCRMCGRNADDHGVVLHVDHMLPVSRGGSDDVANLVTLCKDCNAGKAADTIVRLQPDGDVLKEAKL